MNIIASVGLTTTKQEFPEFSAYFDAAQTTCTEIDLQEVLIEVPVATIHFLGSHFYTFSAK